MKEKNSRRNFIKKSATLALGTIAASALSKSAFASDALFSQKSLIGEGDLFTLPALPYSYDALEPHIDMLTMEIHHSKHHQGYVNKLNKALQSIDSSILGESVTFSTIFKNMQSLPEAIRHNAGGHYNHSLFWSLMKSDGGGEPRGKLAAAIHGKFGSFSSFKSQFTDAAKKFFGSGWAWLIVKDGELLITTTPNQDNPLMQLDSISIKGTPILAIDVWEHAYYIKNQNRRGDYIASWWNVINWETAEEIFEAATAG